MISDLEEEVKSPQPGNWGRLRDYWYLGGGVEEQRHERPLLAAYVVWRTVSSSFQHSSLIFRRVHCGASSSILCHSG